MNLLHVSYAAGGRDARDATENYLRVRAYEPRRLDSSKSKMTSFLNFKPIIWDTGMFLPGETYKVTAIRRKTDFLFKIRGDNKERVYQFDITGVRNLSGAMGFRQMWERKSTYKNIKIYTLSQEE
jgi:hypothetical protein